MEYTLKYFQEQCLPLIMKSLGAKPTKAAIRKGIGAFLKQGDEESIPVVNEDGEPVEITEIILVGAEPAEEVVEDEPTDDEIPAESLQRTVALAVKKALAADTRSRKAPIDGTVSNKAYTLPATVKRWGKVKTFTNTDQMDAETKAYRFGQFFMASAVGNMKAQEYCRTHGLPLTRDTSKTGDDTKAMSENINAAGGFLVPEEFINDLILLQEEHGVVRQEFDSWPMTSDLAMVPRQTGGLTTFFVNDNNTITQSDLSFDQVQLTAKKLATLTKISSELAEDALINIGDRVAGQIARDFALKEDQAGFIGDGSATYSGITGAQIKIDDGTHTAGISTAVTGNTAFGTLDLADFNAVHGLLPQFAEGNAKWYISKAGFHSSMERLTTAAGGNTRDTLANGKTQLMFLGYPVVIVQVMFSTLTASTAQIVALFGDMTQAATFGDRRAPAIATSTEAFFTSDALAVRGTERFDINVHDLGDTSNAGPLVALKTPGS